MHNRGPTVIEIINGSDTGREVWRFKPAGGPSDVLALMLHYYAREERASKRHKWLPAGRWYSHLKDPRTSDFLPAKDAPIPSWVLDEARDKAIPTLRFIRFESGAMIDLQPMGRHPTEVSQ